MNNPLWAKHFINQRFSSGPRMGEDGEKWCRSAKEWMVSFLSTFGATDIDFHKGHYEWSMFAKIGEQWWYFSSGDVRYKLMKSLLVRTADGPKDYMGHANQYVMYNDPDFAQSLSRLLGH